jgi:thioester reductase-like protein
MWFLTGFPGFLGTRLLDRLAEQHPGASFALLIQPKFADKAERTLAELGLTDRADLVTGDITVPDLGLGDRYDALAERITRAMHLAAVYDLTIPRDIGWRVNVDGTRHVVDFLEQAPRLEAFGYVSTAYVSGRRTGLIHEDELVHAAGFKNYYEETKYHAEVVVQERMDRVPTLVFRPGIVVGDSETGATDKFDWPYFLLRALQQLPRYTLMTRIGSGTAPVTLVPVDFVIDAMAHLMARPEHAGTVFHLTDPQPMTAQGILELFLDRLDMHAAYVPVPPAVARQLVGTSVGERFGIAPELIDYFDFDARYDSTHTEDALAGTGIACPPFSSYAGRLVDYVEAHADTRSSAMY